ncbi:phosphotriesterase-related protein-like [Mizuhopecten yessoensis]|uniref:Phosphotriesterase-related protein n=1 Tax=Mizuhopecten yessoensis TaxID=6573 RepID=A0A210PUP4_MIZYE|nr:phosphotriesterase-related protein-like [Mizuhopecten yessoensis]OWF40208.1 Phosphotriesterase-related protein [Mizuhopecten yessoensis]
MAKIQTVLGLIEPSEAGVTMAHEHLKMEFHSMYSPHPDSKIQDKKDDDITMENLWWIRQHPYSSVRNLYLNDVEEAVTAEMEYYKSNGGGTIVDVTTMGIERDIKFLQKVSQETGVNVVSGSGFYVESTRPETVGMTVEEMANVMTADISSGCDSTSIKCGCIGEIGCSWPLGASEKRAVQASGVVQQDLGCPVIFHPGRHQDAPFELVRIYQEAGGRVDKLIMSHLDRTISDVDLLIEFARLGCYCEFDLFGIENSHYQFAEDLDMPNDAERIRRIKSLVYAGFEDRVTIAHDIHTKIRLMKYGGHGFSHILLNILPKMQQRGISKAIAYKMVADNPQRWLAFNPPN